MLRTTRIKALIIAAAFAFAGISAAYGIDSAVGPQERSQVVASTQLAPVPEKITNEGNKCCKNKKKPRGRTISGGWGGR